MTSKPIIAVDVDDVLAASAESFVRFSNEKWGTNLEVDDYDERWAKMWGVDHTEHLRRKEIIYKSKVFTGVREIAGAKSILTKLAKDYKLVVITSRAVQARNDTLKWIEQYYEGIFEEVHLAGFYDVLTSESHKKTKADLCTSVGAEWLIDDHPKHCFACARSGVKALLFGDYSWNRNVKLPDNVFRVENWEEVDKYFERLKSK